MFEYQIGYTTTYRKSIDFVPVEFENEIVRCFRIFFGV